MWSLESPGPVSKVECLRGPTRPVTRRASGAIGWSLISLLIVAAMVLGACAPGAAPTEEAAPPVEQPAATEAPVEPPAPEPMALQLWHQEGEAENAAQYVQALADAYTAMHPEVTFVLTNKQTEVLREDFQTAALAGAPPDLLWTVNDHAGLLHHGRDHHPGR